MFRALWPYAVRYRGRVALAAALLVLAKLSTVAVPVVLKLIVDGLGEPARLALVPAVLLAGYALLRFGGTLFGELRDLVFSRVSHQAIAGFRKRYAGEIAAMQERVVEAVQDVTIADKSERIRRYDQVANELREILETKGYFARDIKWVQVYLTAPPETPRPVFEKGKNKGEEKPVKATPDGGFMMGAGETLVEVQKFDAARVGVYFEAMRSVAEELGELPKPTVNIDNRTLNLFAELSAKLPEALEREPDDDR